MTGVAASPVGRARVAGLIGGGAGLLLALPVWLWWAIWRGAFPTTVWAPGLVYLAAAAVVLAVALPAARPRGARAIALAALAAYAAFSALSMLWASDAGAAWAGAGRATLYALSFALPLLWPPSRPALLAAVSAWPFAALAGGVAGLIGLYGRPVDLAYDTGRLILPAEYANASAALFLMGAFPAILLASRRERAPALRVALLAAAGILTGLALLTQSRGTVLGGAVVVLVALVVTPGRLRLCVPLGLVGVVTLILSDTLLDVRLEAQGGNSAGALDSAVAALAASGLALAALGAVYVLLDRRLRPPPRLVVRANRAALAAVGAAVLVGAVAFVATQGNPVSWVGDRWKDFKTPDYVAVEAGTNRFESGLGSNRYDYWRASVDIAGDRPLRGTGADNFASAYLERRTVQKAPVHAHSIWMTALAELGIPGLLLLAVALAAIAVALVLAGRAAAAPERAVIIAASLPVLYFTTHASGDFLQAFPALVVPALGLAAAATAPTVPAPEPRRRFGAAAAALAAVAAVLILPVFLGARLATRAAETWADRPEAALADLDTAAEVDPLSAAPPLGEAVIALELGRTERAVAAFGEAAERDPKGWFAPFELGLIAAQSGDRERALELIERARRLNPRDPEVAYAERAIRGGTPPDPAISARRIVARGG